MHPEYIFRWIFQWEFRKSPERVVEEKVHNVRTAMGLCSTTQIENSFLPGGMNLETMLSKWKANIIAIGETYKIDASAIAGAISWEYLENWKGRHSDIIQRHFNGKGNDIGLGWGSIHTPAAKELYPNLSEYELNCLRLSAPTAIEMVGKIMADSANLFYEKSNGIWIHDNPVLLAYFFNTGKGKVRASAKKYQLSANIDLKKVIKLNVSVNPMAKWVQDNSLELYQYKTCPRPPKAKLPIVKDI